MTRLTEFFDAAASSSTGYTLSVGDTIQGQLSAGDHDFYRVYLMAGQTYVFSQVGTGSDNVRDTFMRLYNTDGVTSITSNDDGLGNLNSRITYTAATDGYYFIDAGSFGNSYTGQYDLNVSIVSRPEFDAITAAGMIDTDASWSAAPGTGATVTWAARRTGAPTDAQGAAAPFSQFSGAEIAAVTQALSLISDVCGLEFQRLDDGDGFSDAATMLFGNYTSNSDGAGAYAIYPGTGPESGDVWANTDAVSTSSLPLGSYSFFALMHEIGHAVGLSHPGRYNAAPGLNLTYAANAEFQQDSQQFTMMSYFDESATGGEFSDYANSPMLLDIMALQNIYGANTTTRTGNTIYGYSGTAGAAFNFTTGANAFCVWDAGGVDTLNGAAFAGDQIVDLREGEFSSMAGLLRNVSIAFGAAIENATGGGGRDVLYGNDFANALNGGGADAMRGYGGDDTYYVDNAGDQVFEAVGGGSDWVRVLTSYTLAANQEIERLSALYPTSATAMTLIGNAFGQTIEGNAGANLINGGGGADAMRGYGGDDTYYVDNAGDQVFEAAGGGLDWVRTLTGYTLAANQEIERLSALYATSTTAMNLTGNAFGQTIEGNNGANILNGGGGADMLTGRGGADIFRFSSTLGAGNVDVITDFSVADDTIQLNDSVFTTLAVGGLANSAFTIGAAATDSLDRIVYNSGTGALSYDADGSGAGAAVRFATLSTGLALTSADFTVF